MSIAFFDLDRTLIATSSATGWLRREIRLGHLRRRDALRGMGWIALYQLGFSRIEPAIRDAVATLEGQREDDIRQRSLDFWREEVADTVRPGARKVLEQHRRAGDLLVLLTSNSHYIGGAAAEALDIPEVRANRFEVRDGLFTGKTIEPLCFGAGKITHAEALASSLGVSLSTCTFYTDSHSDLPLLERVGFPVVVHPDPRLARAARQRGWRTEDWSRPR